MTTNNAINNNLLDASAKSIVFSPSTSGLVGTPTNNDASVGIVGEFVSSFISGGAAFPSGATHDLTSIALSAGDWDIQGYITFVCSATLDNVSIWTNTTSAMGPGPQLTTEFVPTVAAGFSSLTLQVPYRRISTASPLTLYISGDLNLTSGTCTAYGGVFARRAR